MTLASLSDVVSETTQKYGMDLSRPLVIVSGGPDSVALLKVLVELKSEPTVLHLDHGTCGDESREDAEFTEDLCQRLDIACEVHRLTLEGGHNFQERARVGRYRVAEELADGLGLESIATGHTADDVAETILMNLSRGTGLQGLTDIPPVRGRFVRPLIEATRTEVLAYLDLLQQPYRTDRTNLTGKYTRNRIRQEVLPVLEDLYSGAGNNMARAASLLREDFEALNSIAGQTVYRRGRRLRWALRDGVSRAMVGGDTSPLVNFSIVRDGRLTASTAPRPQDAPDEEHRRDDTNHHRH